MDNVPMQSEAANDVTQEDRDAATLFRKGTIERLLAGEQGGWADTPCDYLVKAFAAHRIAATRKHDPSPLVEALEVIAVGEGCMNGIREELPASALRNIARRALAGASQ